MTINQVTTGFINGESYTWECLCADIFDTNDCLKFMAVFFDDENHGKELIQCEKIIFTLWISNMLFDMVVDTEDIYFEQDFDDGHGVSRYYFHIESMLDVDLVCKKDEQIKRFHEAIEKHRAK